MGYLPTTQRRFRPVDFFSSRLGLARPRHKALPAGRLTALANGQSVSNLLLSQRTCAPGKSWPLVIVDEYLFKTGVPSPCFVPWGTLGKSMYLASSEAGYSFVSNDAMMDRQGRPGTAFRERIGTANSGVEARTRGALYRRASNNCIEQKAARKNGKTRKQ